MCVLQLIKSSYDERSSAHRKPCWRSSIAFGTKKNNAMKTGVCKSIGRQPPIGLTPYWLYRAIVSCCFFSASSCFGYFSAILSTYGFKARILADEMKDFQVVGSTRIFTMMVISRITIPMLNPQPDNQSNRLIVNQRFIHRIIGHPK